MKRLILFVCCAVVLAGCSAVHAPPVVPMEIKIPVMVPCHAVVPVAPVWAVDALVDKGDVWANTLALMATHEQQLGYEAQLLAALRGCVGE